MQNTKQISDRMTDQLPHRSPWPENPVVRLEAPCEGAVLVSETVIVSGWLLGSTELVPLLKGTTSRVKLIIERLDKRQQFHVGMGASGTGLTVAQYEPELDTVRVASVETPRPVLRSLRIGEHNKPILADEVPAGAVGISIEAELDLGSLLPTLAFEGAVIALSFCVEASNPADPEQSIVAVSNATSCLLLPRLRWPEFFGSLTSPTDGSKIVTETLHVEGWSCRLGDAIERVEIRVNGELLDNALVSVPSPDIAAKYPAIDQAKSSRFVLRVPLSRLRSLFPRAGDHFSLQARAVYRSTGELDLHGVRFTAVDERTFLPAEADARGEIEEIRMLPSGEICVRGWCVRRRFGRGEFFLEGRSWRISLVEGGEDEREKGARFRWIARDDIARLAPIFARARSGFELRFSPDSLGAAPGLVRLVYESDGKRAVLSTPGSELRLSELFARQGGASPVKDRISHLLCSAGLRKSFPRNATTHEPEKKTALLVASSNLSLTEGAPKVMFEVLKGAVESGILLIGQVKVIALKDGPLRVPLEELGCTVEVIPELQMYGLDLDRFLGGIERAGAILEQLKPARILANVVDSFWAPLLGIRLGIPCDWIVHESIDPRAAFPQLEPVLRSLFLETVRRTDRMVFVASTTRSLYSGVRGIADSEVIPNGVDLLQIEQRIRSTSRESARKQIGAAPEELVISIIGTTTERKGQDRFIREMAELKRRMPEQRFRFFIVGAREIPFLDVLRRMALEANLSEVVFVPETGDVADYFIGSDLLVIASRQEAAPLVSLEALAYGLPLVSTSVFGLGEQLIDGENAVIFDGDKDGDLAKAVHSLLTDAPRRAKLIAGGSRAVRERFSLEGMVNRYLELLGIG